MPENKICKSNILNYAGNSKFLSMLLEECKWGLLTFYCAYNSSFFSCLSNVLHFLKIPKSKGKICL